MPPRLRPSFGTHRTIKRRGHDQTTTADARVGVSGPGGGSREVSVEGIRLTLKVFLGCRGRTRLGPVCVVDSVSPDSIAGMMDIAERFG
jgi:hypothetical protein